MKTVLMGSELSAFAAQNFAAISPSLAAVEGDTFMMEAHADSTWLGGPYNPRVSHEVTVSTFRMGNYTTNEQWGHFLDLLGDRRFVAIAPHLETGVERVLAIGKSQQELEWALSRRTIRSLFPEAPRRVTLGVARWFAKAVKIDPILDFRPSWEVPRDHSPQAPTIGHQWHESFVYAWLHGCLLPTEWQYACALRTAKALEKGLCLTMKGFEEWMQNWHAPYPADPVKDPLGSPSWKSFDGNKSIRGDCGQYPWRSPDFGDVVPQGKYFNVAFRLVAPLSPRAPGEP